MPNAIRRIISWLLYRTGRLPPAPADHIHPVTLCGTERQPIEEWSGPARAAALTWILLTWILRTRPDADEHITLRTGPKHPAGPGRAMASGRTRSLVRRLRADPAELPMDLVRQAGQAEP